MTVLTDRVRVQRSEATKVIAERLRLDEAWRSTRCDDCLTVAKRLLDARLRLNRAGLLRWRNERRVRG